MSGVFSKPFRFCPSLNLAYRNFSVTLIISITTVLTFIATVALELPREAPSPNDGLFSALVVVGFDARVSWAG